MFRHVAAFEFRLQLRSPVFWVGCLIFFLLTFGSVVIDQIQIGSRGNVHVNAPAAILQTLSIMSLFAVFVIVGLVANSVIRDQETGFAPIIAATSLRKRDYLLGRYSGAVAACFLVLAVMPLAILIGSQMHWLDPEKVGVFRPFDYVFALCVFALPTLLVVSSLVFSVATWTRSLIASYVTALALLVCDLVMMTAITDPAHDVYVALFDPFAVATLQIVTKYWTLSDRNTRLPAMTGVLLQNRLLWTAVALALSAAAYRAFRFETRAARPTASHVAAARTPRAANPPRTPARTDLATTSTTTSIAQLGSLARFDMVAVFRSAPFFVLLGIGALNSMGSLWNTGEWYGGDVFPVTRLMIKALNGAFTLFPLIIATYYGGELVWRDRQHRMHELVDATPAPDWVRLLPKVLAIVLVLIATYLVSALAAILVQLLKGYTRFELGHYLSWYILPRSIEAVLVALLSVFVQVLSPHKFLGWALMLLYVAATVALNGAGFEHVLYLYGASPPVPLSDMNGTGRFWRGEAWLYAYWGAFAAILGLCAYGLWPRGSGEPLRTRVRLLPSRLGARARLGMGVLGLVWLGLLGWIVYNTNVLNEYLPKPAEEARLASREKALIGYERLPQPRITDVQLDVDVYPREARVVTRGRYRLENRTQAPLREVHVGWPARLRLDQLELPGSRVAADFGIHHYRKLVLDVPLPPGGQRELRFITTLAERGFPNSRPLTRVVENGTFVNNTEIAPSIGIDRNAFLKDRHTRHKHGLARELRPPPLEDESARAFNLLRRDSDWVHSDITVRTDADQTPIAPGSVVTDQTSGGRRRVQFRAGAPINHFFSIQSARYQRARRMFRGIELSVYYHPAHAYNVNRMLDAMQTSLATFTEIFSPFQFSEARILEFPGYEDFAQSFACTIPYSESIGFIFNHARSPEKIDMVTYVTAHEIAHQWWGHQVIASAQQGATMLVESFAQYSAMLVMERTYGRDQMRKFLKYELDRYLRSRGNDPIGELPLSRVEDQPYIHYQKGSLALYWLKELVGEDVVNRALYRLLNEFAFKPAPYPQSRIFLRMLREAAGPAHEQLILDLFERITLYDVAVTDARSTPRSDGRFDVSLTVSARKLYADGAGVETEAPLDEPFELGVFASSLDAASFGAAEVLAFERRPLHSGSQTFTLTVARKPAFAGVDPYNKRIDRNSDDNLRAVD